MRHLLLLCLFAASPAVAAKTLPPCPPKAPQLFVAPMGQPFRAPPDAPDPMAAWIAQADANRDATVSRGEFLADADAFFTRLDTDRDGELTPTEMSAYEMGLPEVRLYVPRAAGAPPPRRERRRKDERYEQTRTGAGRYAFLNIPQPVASADADFNRGVTRAEFAAAAADRFARIDALQTGGAAGRLDPAGLPKTPPQAAATLCDPTQPPGPPKR